MRLRLEIALLAVFTLLGLATSGMMLWEWISGR